MADSAPRVFRYRVADRLREMGLGSAHTISLAEVREAATQCRKLRVQGVDPIDTRRNQRTRTKLEAAAGMTFRECAERGSSTTRRSPMHVHRGVARPARRSRAGAEVLHSNGDPHLRDDWCPVARS